MLTVTPRSVIVACAVLTALMAAVISKPRSLSSWSLRMRIVLARKIPARKLPCTSTRTPAASPDVPATVLASTGRPLTLNTAAEVNALISPSTFTPSASASACSAVLKDCTTQRGASTPGSPNRSRTN